MHGQAHPVEHRAQLGGHRTHGAGVKGVAAEHVPVVLESRRQLLAAGVRWGGEEFVPPGDVRARIERSSDHVSTVLPSPTESSCCGVAKGSRSRGSSYRLARTGASPQREQGATYRSGTPRGTNGVATPIPEFSNASPTCLRKIDPRLLPPPGRVPAALPRCCARRPHSVLFDGRSPWVPTRTTRGVTASTRNSPNSKKKYMPAPGQPDTREHSDSVLRGPTGTRAHRAADTARRPPCRGPPRLRSLSVSR